jgi:hypothetical protein
MNHKCFQIKNGLELLGAIPFGCFRPSHNSRIEAANAAEQMAEGQIENNVMNRSTTGRKGVDHDAI